MKFEGDSGELKVRCSLSDGKGIQTQNHLAGKQTLNHLHKLDAL